MSKKNKISLSKIFRKLISPMNYNLTLLICGSSVVLTSLKLILTYT